jgi:hypothetical protein
MKSLCAGFAALVLMTGAGMAQSASTQSSGSATSNTSISAPQSGVQAQTNTGVQGQTQSNGSQTSGQASASTNASAAGNQANANIAAGTTIQAVLDKSLDSKKAKPGDQVVAKTTEDVRSEGKVVIPRGSKIIGRLVQANAQGENSENAALAIVFERAELKKGGSMPLSALIQAIAPPAASLNSMSSANSDSSFGPGGGSEMGPGPASSGGGGVIGNATGAVGGAVNTAGNTVGGVTGGVTGQAGTSAGALGQGISSTGQLTSTANGVIGMPGVQLATISSQSEMGSVLLSKDKRLKLESGTQMTLKVAGSPQ